MKSSLSYKSYTGSCEVSFEDECLHGKILFIDDLITYEGETPKELESSFREAVDRYLDYCKKAGKSANKPYSGSFNVRVGPERHRQAVVAAHAHDMGLNEFVAKAIDTAIATNCFTKVEHIHNHNHNHVVTVQAEAAHEKRVATSRHPAAWETISATTH